MSLWNSTATPLISLQSSSVAMLLSKSSSLRREPYALLGRSRASFEHSLADVEADFRRHAKFVAEGWKSQQILEIISRIAGIDLVPVIDYEIGHINISIPSAI